MRSNSRLANISGLSRSSAVVALAAGAYLVSGGQLAAAQTPAAKTTASTNEIVVTAQFRSQNLQDTPLAITAIGGEQLERRSVTTLANLSGIAPNVNLQTASSTYGPATAAFIRGVGQYDTNFALEPGVGIYVDDVYLSTLHGSLIDLLDLKRVEVLRGPQGTLAGQNSIGGAVKLYSTKPGEGGSYVQAAYGSYHRVELRGAADFAIVPDKLFARVSGTSVNADGYVQRYDYACTHPGTTVPSFKTGSNCKIGTEGGKAYTGIRTALRYTPDSKFELTLSADYTNDNSEAAPSTLLYVGVVPAAGAPAVAGITGLASAAANAPYQINGTLLGTAAGSPFISYSPFGGALDTYSSSPYISYENYMNYAPRDGTAPYNGDNISAVDSWGVAANASYQINEYLSLTSITGYRAFEGQYTTAESSPVNTTLQTNGTRHWQFSEEARLNASVPNLVDFTVGGYYFKARSNYDGRISLPTLEFVESDIIPAETKAAFATADFRVTDALHVIGGVRYSDISKTFVYGRKGIPGSITGGAAPAAVAPLDGLKSTFSFTRADYRGSVQYRWSPNFMTYVQFSTGFKGGGINPRPFFPAQALSHNPETLDAYEGGFKADLFDRKLRLNGAGFLNKYKEIVMTVVSCPLPGAPAAPCALPINAGAADVKGAELEASFHPTEALSFDASAGYLDFKYTSISAAAVAAGITLGMDSPFVQKWQYSLGAQYEMNLDDLGTLTPRLDLNHQDPYFAQAINRAPFNLVQGRDVLNARLTYLTASRDWQASLAVTNLTDELYYDGIFDNRGSTRTIQGRPAAPRQWMATIRRNF